MASVLESPPQTAPQDDRRFVLYDVSWDVYELLLDQLGDRPGVRVAYDQGTLELVSPTRRHEKYKQLVGLMISLIGLEFKIRIESGGSTTFKRKDLQRGIEPDQCYWIDCPSLPDIEEDIDPATFPPDLFIEIDITRSSINRQAVCAALGIGEIWRFDGIKVEVYQLRDDGRYELCDDSGVFPFLPIEELTRFLHSDQRSDESQWMQTFVDWLRELKEKG